MTGSDEDIPRAKRALRASCEVLRAEAERAAGAQAGAAAAGHFFAAVNPPAGCVVSGYWPMRHEFDVRPLLTAFHERGHVCALPVVTGRDRPLLFRQWRPGADLVEGSYGALIPKEDAAEVVPALLLVPMLAYDARGYRLGYGGGYYDRTLSALEKPIAVGCAYDAQRIDVVPVNPYDRRLDWVVTEKRAQKIEVEIK